MDTQTILPRALAQDETLETSREKTAAVASPPPDDKATNLPRITIASAAALATAACGGGGSPPPSSGGGGPPVQQVRKPASDAEAARFLLQADLGVSTAAISALKDQGYEPWLTNRMQAQNDQSARQFFSSRGFDQVDANRHYDSTTTGDYMIWSQLMTGGNTLRKRFALALSEFFVVSLNSIDIAWRSVAIGAYWDILNRNAFGNFRDLIEEITLNPAMGVFLNTRGNRAADPSTGRVPDENYGREVMQLFSIGLFELNLDGTLKQSGGQPIETYTNEDVTGIAKAFTGYDFDYSGIGYTTQPGSTRQIPDAEYTVKPMTADPARWQRPRTTGYHSGEEKRFLGLTIPAGTNATDTLKRTLDHLVAHPNVGPFFAKQMIQRMVTSNPSPAYVERVARVFENNGSGRRGDLGAVYRAIMLDNEALDPAGATNPAFGKLREPMLRFVQLGRTFGMRSTSGNWQLGNMSDPASRLGQSPLRSPSVFNFFRPSYFPTNSQASANNLLAPEFQLVNETSVAGYINFMERAVDTTHGFLSDVTLNYTTEVDMADNSAALVDRLDLLLTANQLSSDVKTTIRNAIDSVAIGTTDPAADRLRRVHVGVLLTMASTDYLVQK